MLLNCGVGEDSWESLGLQGDPTSPSKEIQPVHPKGDQSWVFFGRNDAKVETPVLWPPHVKSWLIGKESDAGRDWGQVRRGRQRMRWLDGIIDQWTWVWVNSGCWWWTGRPGVLRFMGSERVRHDWATELNSVYQWEIFCYSKIISTFVLRFLYNFLQISCKITMNKSPLIS